MNSLTLLALLSSLHQGATPGIFFVRFRRLFELLFFLFLGQKRYYFEYIYFRGTTVGNMPYGKRYNSRTETPF